MVPPDMILASTPTGDTWTLWNGLYIRFGSDGTSNSTVTNTYASPNGKDWIQMNNEWWTDTRSTNTAATWINWIATDAAQRIAFPPTIPLPGEEFPARPIEAPAVLAGEALRLMRERENEVIRRLEEDARKRRAEQDAAEKRAYELLMSVLNPQQQAMYKEKHCFILRCGENTYRINRGRTRNIEVLAKNGRVIKTLCAHPGPYVPSHDNLVAQKLALETDERAFLAVANHS